MTALCITARGSASSGAVRPDPLSCGKAPPIRRHTGRRRGIIVTANVRHFPTEALEPYKILAQEPRGFVSSLIDADSEFTVAAFAADRARLRNPAMSPDQYIANLQHAGLTATGAAPRTFIDIP